LKITAARLTIILKLLASIKNKGELMSRSKLAIARAFFALAIFPSVSLSAPLGTIETTFSFHADKLITDPNRPYVYATAGSALEFINTNTLTVEKSLSLSGNGLGLSLSPDDNTLYVAAATRILFSRSISI
jgi:DNA-binding beta-propeller fold protein YncE